MDFCGIVDQMFAAEQKGTEAVGGGVRTTNIHCPLYWKRQQPRFFPFPRPPLSPSAEAVKGGGGYLG